MPYYKGIREGKEMRKRKKRERGMDGIAFGDSCFGIARIMSVF